jgi:hypothetical protein
VFKLWPKIWGFVQLYSFGLTLILTQKTAYENLVALQSVKPDCAQSAEKQAGGGQIGYQFYKKQLSVA